MKAEIYNKIVIFLVLTICVAAFLFDVPSSGAVSSKANQTQLAFNAIAEHPYASLQPTVVGRTINNMKVLGKQLYFSYGDYGANTGPVFIKGYDLINNKFKQEELSFSSEATNAIREFDNKLFFPNLDRKNCAFCNHGFATAPNGQIIDGAMSTHIFDYAKFQGKHYLFGSGESSAQIYESHNLIDWSVVVNEDTFPQSSSERFYWGLELNGNLYAQSYYGGVGESMHVYDGVSWSRGATGTLCDSSSFSPEVFNGKIICTSGGELTSFNGSQIKTIPLPNTCPARDVDTSGGKLVILCGNFANSQAYILLTSDLTRFDRYNGVPNNSYSTVIFKDKIYVGTDDANLFSSNSLSVSSNPTTTSTTTPSSTTTTGNTGVNSIDSPAASSGSSSSLGKLSSLAGFIDLNSPIDGTVASYASSPGRGFWRVASDGGIFASGRETFHCPAGSIRLTSPIGRSDAYPFVYNNWMRALSRSIIEPGELYEFGEVNGINKTIVAMSVSSSGRGYWLVAIDGNIFAFANAQLSCSADISKLDNPNVSKVG